MNIYLHELRSYRKNTIIWIISMCVVTFFFFSLYPAFAGGAAELVKILQAYPEAVMAALGIDVNDIASVTGFYSVILTFIALSGAVQAIYLGISVIAKETTGKTADFLLTKPVKRRTVITAKLLSVFTCIAITSALYMIVSGPCARRCLRGGTSTSRCSC